LILAHVDLPGNLLAFGALMIAEGGCGRELN
jgi:hypothetical protein